MEFSRPEYRSGQSFPSPGDLPNPGSNPGLPHCRQILYRIAGSRFFPELSGKTSLVAQTVKRLPIMWETWVQSLGQEDLLEKEMYSSILAWKIPWTEEHDRL